MTAYLNEVTSMKELSKCIVENKQQTVNAQMEEKTETGTQIRPEYCCNI